MVGTSPYHRQTIDDSAAAGVSRHPARQIDLRFPGPEVDQLAGTAGLGKSLEQLGSRDRFAQRLHLGW